MLLKLLSLQLSLRGIIGHHYLAVKYWIVQNHLLVILHILLWSFDALMLGNAVKERSLQILLRKRSLIETDVLVWACDLLWGGTGAEPLQFGQLALVKSTVWVLRYDINDAINRVIKHESNIFDSLFVRCSPQRLRDDRLSACDLQEVQFRHLFFNFMLDSELLRATARKHSFVLLYFKGLQDEFGIDACRHKVFL